MIKVVIADTSIRHQSGNSKTTGKPYDMHFQDAWFHLTGKDGKPAPYPQKVELILEKAEDGAPLFYPVGQYELAPSSVYVDRSGKLALSPRLVAAKPAAPVTPRAA